MIKLLKQYQVQTAPFNATKDWNLNNIDNDNLLLFESTGSDDGLPIALEFIDYGDGSEYPVDNNSCDIALEQQNDDLATNQTGLNVMGIVNTDTEPVNSDGTYQRSIYHQVKTMFYNNYLDPSKIWGIENIDFTLSKTQRILADEFRLMNIPRTVFGDKIVPNTVNLFDDTQDNDYTITDDGNGNLFAGTNVFSHQQELGEYINQFIANLSSSYCNAYFFYPVPPAPILSASNAMTIGVVNLSWITSSNHPAAEGFYLQKSTDDATFFNLALVAATASFSYTDTGLILGQPYYYRVYAFNDTGSSQYSNTLTVTLANIPAPVLTASNGTMVSSSVLSWTTSSNFPPATGFYLQKSFDDITFNNLATISSTGSFSYTDTNLMLGQPYYYRVYAFNYYSNLTASSQFSNVITVQLPTDPLADPSGSIYTLGPYDTFESYVTGSTPASGGFGWASGWDIRTPAAPDYALIVSIDNGDGYLNNSGSSAIGMNSGYGWVSAWTGSM